MRTDCSFLIIYEDCAMGKYLITVIDAMTQLPIIWDELSANPKYSTIIDELKKNHIKY